MQGKHTALLTAQAKDYEHSNVCKLVKCVMQTLTALTKLPDIHRAFDAVTQHCNYCLFSEV